MDDETRTRHIAAVHRAHRTLLDHLGTMTGGPGANPSEPSQLPGWTRGHVLTHIARNADSFVRVLHGAERGDVVSQYEGGVEGRNADIEAGAGRDWEALVEDVRSSAERLEAVFTNQDNWDLAMVNALDEQVPHRDIPFRRLREVLIHHADLGDSGYTPEHWPDDYQREELRRMEMVYNARKPMGTAGLPERALEAPPLQRLCWLVGRGEIEGLEPAGVF